MGEYIGVKANVVRLVYVAATVLMSRFAGIIIYIVLAFIMPDKQDTGYEDYRVE